MYHLLFALIIGAFIAMLAVNVIYRVRIFKKYKYLVQNRVQFTTAHFFNRERLETEVLTKYPDHRSDIEEFIQMIQRSVQLASVLIVIITAFGYMLMKFR